MESILLKASSHSSSTTVARSLALLLMFCFAGCASGSCLSYGHACWGAHGKRNFNFPSVQEHRFIDTHRERSLSAEVETDGNASAPSNQNRWILSRLITGRLTVPTSGSTAGNRRSNRWHETQKILDLPGNWDTYHDINRNELLRYEKDTTMDGTEKENNSNDPFELTKKLLQPYAKTTEVLLVPSRNMDDNYPVRLGKFRLFKILADSSENKLN